MVDTLIADILRLSKYEMLYNMLIKYSETSQEKQSCRLFQTSIHQIQTDGGSGEICKPSLPVTLIILNATGQRWLAYLY